MSGVQAVAADSLTVDSYSVDVFLAADTGNQQVVRVAEDIYRETNLVTFNNIAPTNPIRLEGYGVAGTIPSTRVTVQYRLSDTGDWRNLPTSGATVSVNDYLDLRAKVALAPKDIIDGTTIDHILVYGQLA